MSFSDTIVACATGQQNAALAIIRISGESAFHILSTSLLEKEKFGKATASVIKRYTIIDNLTNQTIDEVTIIKYLPPKSYTGENLAEILCHGNVLITNKVISVLIDNGARLALGGEFTKRAFVNGKVSLTKAEAINQIITTKTQVAHQNAIISFSGKDIVFFEEIKTSLLSINSLIENQLEFSALSNPEILRQIDFCASEISSKLSFQLHSFSKVKELESVISVAIIGPPNAGKSSLMNLILGHTRSIVHDSRGTTRDFVSENIKIGDIPVKLIDTAGQTSTPNEIETAGVKYAKAIMNTAQIVIWVSPANAPFEDEENSFSFNNQQSVFCIVSKKDIDNDTSKVSFFMNNNWPTLAVSLIDTSSRNLVLSQIHKSISDHFSIDNNTTCFINSLRQEAILSEILIQLSSLLADPRLEIKSFFLQKSLSLFDDLFGKTSSEDAINNVFSTFCVGK